MYQEAVAEDDHELEEEEEEEDEDARWRRLEAEEATDEAAAAKKEARARAKAKAEAQLACTDNDEDTQDYSSEGDTSSSDTSNATTSSEEVTSRKRLRDDDEAGKEGLIKTRRGSQRMKMEDERSGRFELRASSVAPLLRGMVGFGSQASMELRSGPRRRSARLLPLYDGRDLISTLPDDLLLLVLARLPCAAAAVRTGILSRRWRGLWARLRRIVLNDVAFHSLEAALGRFPPPPPAVSLLQIRPPKPQERVPKKHRADAARFRALLRAAARLDPEEFFLVLPLRFVGRSLRLKLPCFYRTTSIVLDLCSTIRCVPAGAEFPALQTLSLSCCTRLGRLPLLLP
ncbi:hypothetical protein QYE76_036712 [Lolium multiflorum]|uniref:F-box domain-containing protein n=1 Tax=Lolium multiflorum TaxID=4521 RepID=A0AAD8VNB9_LOLMU|nr:hypothetical protein QYE76_036712 [Lolium multiflorum]